MSEERCGLCRYWLLSNWAEAARYESGAAGPNCDGSESFCRRYAPRSDGFPMMGRQGWCGEFKRDPARGEQR